MPSAEEIKQAAEQRAYPRVPTAIPARISIPAESAIRECMVTDLSAGGAGLQFAEAAPRAEMICLLTINGFGSFEGITTRDSGAVRGVRFLFGESERRHLQENLIAFIKDGMSAVSELCKRERGPERTQLSFTRTNGEHHHCKVRNISLQGVALQTQVRPAVGELVKLARMYGRVVQHDEDGIGIQFVNFVTGPDQTPAPSVTLTA
jgi:hypothetical protein